MIFNSADNNSLSIDELTLDKFKAAFHGRLIDQMSPDYDSARRVWNALIDKRPAMIAICSGQADVITAVNFARRHNILLSVRGGGHNVSGSALCDNGLTIDLSDMRAVRVDCYSNTVHAQGGSTLGEIDRETQVFGLATTTGNVSETGVAGLTLGGGFGNLRRKYGLSIDNLASVDIVTADGQVLRASKEKNPDLFWAVRGGGGNFGVVTSFEFRLFPVGPEVYFAAQFFDIDEAVDACRSWRDFMEEAPDEISSLGFFWTVPRVEAFPPDIQGRRVFLYGALHSGTAAEGETALAPLRKIGNHILDLSGIAPYCSWQSGFDAFFTSGDVYTKIYAYWKSLYISGLTDVLIDDLVETARNVPSEQCLIAIWHLGGAMSRIAEDATAFGKRDAPYLLSFDSCWVDPTLSKKVITWTREQIIAAESYSDGGSYLNFPGFGENSEVLVRAAYGKNYARLAQIKHAYDPGNLFRVNQNICPRDSAK